MAETIEISPDGCYIAVQSFGQPSLTELEQSVRRISELRTESGIDRILVDSRQRSEHPPASEIYAGGDMLAKTFGSKVRIAVVVRHIEDSHELFENVVVNRGGVVAFFSNLDQAKAWLVNL